MSGLKNILYVQVSSQLYRQSGTASLSGSEDSCIKKGLSARAMNLSVITSQIPFYHKSPFQNKNKKIFIFYRVFCWMCLYFLNCLSCLSNRSNDVRVVYFLSKALWLYESSSAVLAYLAYLSLFKFYDTRKKVETCCILQNILSSSFQSFGSQSEF